MSLIYDFGFPAHQMAKAHCVNTAGKWLENLTCDPPDFNILLWMKLFARPVTTSMNSVRWIW